MEITVDKRERSSNFTFEETDLLLSLVEERKAIIECKKTDAVTNKTKEKEWETLTLLYNSKCSQFRTARMLRNKWESLKKLTRKEMVTLALNAHTQSRLCIEERMRKAPWTERIAFIMGDIPTRATNAVEYITNHEDTLDEKSFNIIASSSNYLIQNLSPVDASDDKSSAIELKTEGVSHWDTWDPLSKEPVLEDIQENREESSACENITTVSVDDSISCPRNTRKKKKIVRSTADSKKFSDLVDKKLELIHTQIGLLKTETEARMEMERERHNMQMKILEAELKLKEKMLHSDNS